VIGILKVPESTLYVSSLKGGRVYSILRARRWQSVGVEEGKIQIKALI